MSAPGRRRRIVVRRKLEERVVWPLLDLRDWLFRRRDQGAPRYEAVRSTRRQRIGWAALDAREAALAGFKRRWPSPAARATLVAIPVALLAGVGIATWTGDDTPRYASVNATAEAPAKKVAPPRAEVAGVSDSAAERRARRAELRRERAADRRRAARRQRAAERKRASARKRAKKRAARARAAAPTPVASPPVRRSPSSSAGSSGGSTPSAPAQQSAPPPRSRGPRAPSGGGRGGGGGGPPRQPQPPPGVAFDDAG